MKKKPGFALRSVCGEQFLIAEGLSNIDFSKLIALNESSAYLWNAIDDGEERAYWDDVQDEVMSAEVDLKRVLNRFWNLVIPTGQVRHRGRSQLSLSLVSSDLTVVFHSLVPGGD